MVNYFLPFEFFEICQCRCSKSFFVLVKNCESNVESYFSGIAGGGGGGGRPSKKGLGTHQHTLQK